MARLVLTIGLQRDTCSNEVELRAQIVDNVLGSIVNTIGRA